jgi:hypothetical protein
MFSNCSVAALVGAGRGVAAGGVTISPGRGEEEEDGANDFHCGLWRAKARPAGALTS